MADFLDEKHKEIQARLKELKPLVEEYQLLQAADEALSSLAPGSTRSATVSAPAATATASAPAPSTDTPRRTRRTASSRRASAGGGSGSGSGSGRRGRPRGSGTRATQALDLVRSRPGITIPEMAESMGIQQNYLYRVLPGLAEEGKVVKSGRGWHIRDGA
jgi:hypothetical protein